MNTSNAYHLNIELSQLKSAGQSLMKIAISELLYEEIIRPTKVEYLPKNKQRMLFVFDKINLEVIIKPKKFGGFIVYSINDKKTGDSFYNLTDFFVELCESLNMDNGTKAYMVKEINHTWLAEAHLYTKHSLTSEALSNLSGSVVDSALRGHPWIVMGKGRLGFGYEDYKQYVPEVAIARKLPWFAVHKSLAVLSLIQGLTCDCIYKKTLGEGQYKSFKNILMNKGLDSQEYLFLPIHPWQWSNWISLNYALEISEQKLLFLEMSNHEYLPLQSIRTFSDMTDKTAYHIKLPLSILNTAVYRGLPNKRNFFAPQISEWLLRILKNDQQLQETGVVLLGELATVTVKQPAFDKLSSPPYQFTELLGCLWRDSVENYITDNQKVISQAALIHKDRHDDFLLPHLIHRSGLTVVEWLKKFFKVCVTPLLYWLYRYGIVFSPHGENSLLIHENGIPIKMVLKDFVDDINLVDDTFFEQEPKPKEVGILLKHSPKDLSHFIFTGLFVVHYRYIFDVLHQYYNISEFEFWNELSKIIDEFHHQHPELNERIALFDLKRPKFEKVCLNRVRFFTRGYQDNANRPEPVVCEPICNPISPQFLRCVEH